MPLMSIIGCTEDEKEIVRLLSEDGMIEHLLVMGDPKASELMSDLEQMGLKPQLLFPEKIPHNLKKSKDFNVLVTLHDKNRFKSMQHMKEETYEKIKFYGLVSNGILMFDESCNDLIEDAETDFGNCNFFLEPLSSKKERQTEKISVCVPEAGKDNTEHNDLVDKYRNCYNRLKDLMLTPKTK